MILRPRVRHRQVARHKAIRASILWLCTGLLFTAACTTHGARFTRPEPETLVLGKTRYADIVAQVGQPNGVRTVTRNGQTVNVADYLFVCLALACKSSDWGEPGFIPERRMAFFFVADVLVGYHYTSTGADRTDFDDAKVYLLKSGQTTRSQAVELLGNPSGQYVYPLIASKSDTALVYFFAGTKVDMRPVVFRRDSPFKPMTKHLVVSFDTDGLVSGANLVPAGEQ